MRPIFHLSFPVIDLDASLVFYTEKLGGRIGRREQEWADVALFGAQITLQHRPQDILHPMPRSRHFGATLDWQEWEKLTGGLNAFVEEPRNQFAGTEREQAKAMLADPSGNLIEIKAYRHPVAVLDELAS